MIHSSSSSIASASVSNTTLVDDSNDDSSTSTSCHKSSTRTHHHRHHLNNEESSRVMNYSIFWPYTFLLDSSETSSLQNRFQSFYQQLQYDDDGEEEEEEEVDDDEYNNIPYTTNQTSNALFYHYHHPFVQQQQQHNQYHHPQNHQQRKHEKESSYDILKSTEDNYKLKSSSSSLSSSKTRQLTNNHHESSHEHVFSGKYQDIRATLDYNYHSNYIPSRQLVQDEIIQYILSKNQQCQTHNHNNYNYHSPPWIVFTAGAMGAGKSYTIKHLHSQERFPLHKFITVDPDEIRHLLPEYQYYIQQTNDRSMMEYAGVYTKKESGYIAEILVHIALRNGCNVLMDGSLRDYNWYTDHFVFLRQLYLGIQIGIIHVQAPKDTIFQRAKARSKITKRIVPRHVIEESLDTVPKSVKVLSQYVEFFVELYNYGPTPDNVNNDIEIMTEGLTWDTFRQVFYEMDNRIAKRSNSSSSSHETSSMRYNKIHNLMDVKKKNQRFDNICLMNEQQWPDDMSSIYNKTSEQKQEHSRDYTIKRESKDRTIKNDTAGKKPLSPLSISAGLKVDKELDYQLLRLLSKL